MHITSTVGVHYRIGTRHSRAGISGGQLQENLKRIGAPAPEERKRLREARGELKLKQRPPVSDS